MNVLALLTLFGTCSQGFMNGAILEKSAGKASDRSDFESRLYLSTPQKPLYDGTNYTFPDTTTPNGIAEALEVSFVNACMQLRSGYVDVLKLFIAAAMSSYQLGFPLNDLDQALEKCPSLSANRPLMPEEIELRKTWYSLVYLTLFSIGHSTVGSKDILADTIPEQIRSSYSSVIEGIAKEYKAEGYVTSSVEKLFKVHAPQDLSEMDKAIMSQSIRVVTLTLTVLQEALEAGPGGQSPPPPPIKGAFD